MGSRRGAARVVRWIGSIFCVASLTLSASAAVGSVPFANGDFSSGVYLQTPDYWNCYSESCKLYDAANGGPFVQVYKYGGNGYVSQVLTPGDFILNEGWRGGNYSVSGTFRRENDDFSKIEVVWKDLSGAVLATHESEIGADAEGVVLSISESVPLTAETAEVRYYCIINPGGGCFIGVYPVSPMTITYTAVSNSAPGEGTPIDVIYDPGDLDEIVGQAQDVYDFVCGGGLEASALSLVPDVWGGAGIGGQIAMVSNQLQQLCFLEGDQQQQAAQTDALTAPDTRPAIASPNNYSDPTDTPLSDLIDTYIAPSANQSDDLVTSANRTNDLLVASIRYQNAAYERAFGTGSARPSFQTEGGPLMSEANVDLDPQIDFVEGDYGQMYGKLSANLEASSVAPDAAGASDLLPAESALDPAGSCMGLNIPKPTGPVETIEDALALLRWNSAVALSGTNMGEFLCSMVDRPERVVTEFCIGSESAMSIGGATMAEAEPICIYGSNAPSYMNVLIGFLPTISLLLAGVGIVKMVF